MCPLCFEQFEQDTDPLGEACPASHAVQFSAPFWANVPGSHTTHFERSALGAKPTSHGMQLVEPGGATEPGVQFVEHSEAPSSENVPGSHSTHVLRSVHVACLLA